MNTVTTPAIDNSAAEDEALVVDVQISVVVLDAALARLPFVQAEEKKRNGKASTNLSTLAVAILTGWKPSDTKRPDSPRQAECPTCLRVVNTYPTGKLRVHGSPGKRCPTAWAPDARGKVNTRPLRFPMNRGEYEAIRDRIHIHGRSVANVLTQRLADFALNGEL